MAEHDSSLPQLLLYTSRFDAMLHPIWAVCVIRTKNPRLFFLALFALSTCAPGLHLIAADLIADRSIKPLAA
jgi:hypothetical protein